MNTNIDQDCFNHGVDSLGFYNTAGVQEEKRIAQGNQVIKRVEPVIMAVEEVPLETRGVEYPNKKAIGISLASFAGFSLLMAGHYNLSYLVSFGPIVGLSLIKLLVDRGVLSEETAKEWQPFAIYGLSVLLAALGLSTSESRDHFSEALLLARFIMLPSFLIDLLR